MKLTVVKVGGAVVEDAEALNNLLNVFCALEGNKILVHGGGRSATKLAARLGIETRMVNGRRITDSDMIDIVTMVYGGLVNKTVVAALQAKGVNAIGLTGADANILRSHRRPVKDGVDYGFVGDADYSDASALQTLLSGGLTPVIAPLTHDGKGQILNINADTMAAETAKALAKAGNEVTLVYCFEKPGVLRNPDDDESVIPTITRADYERYVSEGVISGGMMPKIENSLASVEAGVKQVVITCAPNIGKPNCGTVIK
jgi:acetylglutamate kinase